jgi:MipA family protein
MRGLTAPIAAVLMVMGAVPAAAADPNTWTISIGAEAGVVPAYDGANRYIFRPFPLLDLRKAGTPPRFHSPREGFGIGLIDLGNFRMGPVGKLRYQRKESSDANLRGLGDVDWAFEVGAFAEYWVLPWLRAYGELRQGFGGHHGLVSDILIDAVYRATPDLTFSAGPRLTLQSDKAVSPYFDVSAAQSLTSGLPVYDAKGGVTSWGAGGQVRYTLSPQWRHIHISSISGWSATPAIRRWSRSAVRATNSAAASA